MQKRQDPSSAVQSSPLLSAMDFDMAVAVVKRASEGGSGGADDFSVSAARRAVTEHGVRIVVRALMASIEPHAVVSEAASSPPSGGQEALAASTHVQRSLFKLTCEALGHFVRDTEEPPPTAGTQGGQGGAALDGQGDAAQPGAGHDASSSPLPTSEGVALWDSVFDRLQHFTSTHPSAMVRAFCIKALPACVSAAPPVMRGATVGSKKVTTTTTTTTAAQNAEEAEARRHAAWSRRVATVCRFLWGIAFPTPTAPATATTSLEDAAAVSSPAASVAASGVKAVVGLASVGQIAAGQAMPLARDAICSVLASLTEDDVAAAALVDPVTAHLLLDGGGENVDGCGDSSLSSRRSFLKKVLLIQKGNNADYQRGDRPVWTVSRWRALVHLLKRELWGEDASAVNIVAATAAVGLPLDALPSPAVSSHTVVTPFQRLCALDPPKVVIAEAMVLWSLQQWRQCVTTINTTANTSPSPPMTTAATVVAPGGEPPRDGAAVEGGGEVQSFVRVDERNGDAAAAAAAAMALLIEAQLQCAPLPSAMNQTSSLIPEYSWCVVPHPTGPQQQWVSAAAHPDSIEAGVGLLCAMLDATASVRQGPPSSVPITSTASSSSGEWVPMIPLLRAACAVARWALAPLHVATFWSSAAGGGGGGGALDLPALQAQLVDVAAAVRVLGTIFLSPPRPEGADKDDDDDAAVASPELTAAALAELDVPHLECILFLTAYTLKAIQASADSGTATSCLTSKQSSHYHQSKQHQSGRGDLRGDHEENVTEEGGGGGGGGGTQSSRRRSRFQSNQSNLRNNPPEQRSQPSAQPQQPPKPFVPDPHQRHSPVPLLLRRPDGLLSQLRADVLRAVKQLEHREGLIAEAMFGGKGNQNVRKEDNNTAAASSHSRGGRGGEESRRLRGNRNAGDAGNSSRTVVALPHGTDDRRDGDAETGSAHPMVVGDRKRGRHELEEGERNEPPQQAAGAPTMTMTKDGAADEDALLEIEAQFVIERLEALRSCLASLSTLARGGADDNANRGGGGGRAGALGGVVPFSWEALSGF